MKKITSIFLLSLLITSCGQNNLSFEFTFDSTKGKVTSNKENGKYPMDTMISLKALPKTGYEFAGYYSNDTLINSAQIYSFKLVESISIDARFSEVIVNENEVPLKGTIIPGQDGVTRTKYEVIPVNEYYKDFDFSLKGDALKSEIKRVSSPKFVFSYKETSNAIRFIDEDIDNFGTLYGIYDEVKFPNIWDSGHTWNKEHVWARSRMKKSSNYAKAEGDLHNLRACTPSVNSRRGNDCFDDNQHAHYFYPNLSGDHRGDIARILFYMYCQYDGLNIVESPAAVSDSVIGKLSVLKKWNKEDPVSEFEIQRNMKVSMYQGNRNAFIDFPDLVDSLF